MKEIIRLSILVAGFCFALPTFADSLWQPTEQRLAKRFSEPLFAVPVGAAQIHDALANLKPEVTFKTRGSKENRIYDRYSRAVVLIVTENSLGSGVVLNAAGDVLTNWHVVAGAAEVGVIFKPQQEGRKITRADVQVAQVIKVDEVADLALVRLRKAPAGIQSASLGSDADVRIGDDVHAIGHPTGQVWTYTRGLVSQYRKGYSWTTESGKAHKADVIQTQTPINPGNSGGPLFADSGKMVGVNAFKSGGEGLNFAVSVNEVRRFLATDRSRSATEAKSEECESRSGRPKADTVLDVPGVSTAVDFDCDDKIDGYFFEPNNEAEAALFFLLKDNKLAMMVFDSNRDGYWERSYIYKPDSDKPAAVGIHGDGTLRPTSFEAYVEKTKK